MQVRWGGRKGKRVEKERGPEKEGGGGWVDGVGIRVEAELESP